MNRAKRREYERKYGHAFAMQLYRNEVYRQGENAGKNEVIEKILLLTAYTLNYKLGLGPKRLPDIMEAILNNIDSFRTGQLTPADYAIIKEQVSKLGFSID